MANIKKRIVPIPDYFASGRIGETISEVKIYVDLTDTSLEIKITQKINGDSIVVLWHKVESDVIKNIKGITDYTLYGVHSPISMNDQDGIPTGPYSLVNANFIDLYSNSFIDKLPLGPQDPTNNNPYCILIDDITSDFSTWTVMLKMPSETAYTIEGPSASVVTAASVVPSSIALVPNITLSAASSTITSDSSVNITVSSDIKVKEVFIEPVYGMTNKQRVKLTNGTGSFTAYSTDMSAGESIRIKVGYRKVTGISDIVIPVV